jgi:hypothetical protein
MTNPGHKWGLALGAVGLAMAGGIVAALGAGSVISDFPVGVATGAAATLAASWWLGGRVRPRLQAASLARAVALGASVAVTTLQIGILSGSLPQLFFDADVERWGLGTELLAYIVKPLYWMNLFGLVPAIVLGAFFGVTVAGASHQRAGDQG